MIVDPAFWALALKTGDTRWATMRKTGQPLKQASTLEGMIS